MERWKPNIILLAVLSLLLMTACDDDVPDSTIGGSVVDNDGQPVAGAAILLVYDIPLYGGGAKPQTSIDFSLPDGAVVRLYITDDCRGETVRVLLDEEVSAGAHAVTWDARNEAGDVVVPGVYHVHIVFGEEHHTRELFLHEVGYAGRLTAEGLDSFATTDENGRFAVDQGCLAFGHTLHTTDEQGNPTGDYTIPHRATIWAIHDNHGSAAGPAKMTVSPTEGATVKIVFPVSPPYGDLRDFATEHWNVTRLDCAFDHACQNEGLAGAGHVFFPDIEDYQDLPLWIDPLVDEAEFLDNIGRWQQFVFGWDDFLHPAEFMGEDYVTGDISALNDPRCSANREIYRTMLTGKMP